MPNATYRIPTPINEPVLGYAPGSPERARLDAERGRQSAEPIDIPLIIGGEEVRTGNTMTAVVPHRHEHVLATVHLAGPAEIDRAIDAAQDAQHDWSRMAPADRASIFLRAADLLAGPWRMRLNAATMLNQSKTCHQADIDAACEMIDFFRFNALFMQEIYANVQPPVSGDGVWNRVEVRPLEGFVYAISPFNFTSIAGNLSHAPALMGNVVIWKPSPSSLFSNYMVMKLFEAAGLPPGVINFLPGEPIPMTAQLFSHEAFGGVHFTGSTGVFRSLWQQIGERLPTLRDYPRIVGETGGKDFIVAHPSANADAVRTAIIRGGYEFQGQKCSAASRVYVPRSMWTGMKDTLVEEIDGITMGDVGDYANFMGAVINRASFEKCRRYIEAARTSSDAEIVAGGVCDDSTGYFVRPTLIVASDPGYASMREEIFGPVVSLFVYEDDAYGETLDLCNDTSPYALTGAIFADDRAAVDLAFERLRYAAGNFYINDKPTGAVVGQQPFGGSRASGTNDKAGSALNLLRWVTPRTIKETFVPATEYRYPFMG